MLIYGFSHSVALRMFPCVAWSFITDKADKTDLLLLTRRPFRSMDIAVSHEVNRQGQRNRFIHNPRLFILCKVFAPKHVHKLTLTIAEHAYDTCLNGYAHFSSLFLCAINDAI